ncbi:hypothetical protein HYALB_00011256 [Hymenoscyphus albidus]|uniref:Uncharacterized protein n=1 Tax=Hymenoscyphus albidus TaxID=595503 RepID=A0A9N9LYH7_9HELO|nr:hypothetical protein HYALB_00011256 [Hymenoscyphus albidus]
MENSLAALDTTTIDENLVGSISQILNEHGIPSVQWGNYLLTLYGVPSIVDSIDFIVPDSLIPNATHALQPTGLLACTEPSTCTAIAKNRASPIPKSHFHIDSEFTVSLYEQSTTLWVLPSLTQSTQSVDIISASDSRLPTKRPGRGHGRFRNTTFPVQIPTAHRLLESYVRSIAIARRGSYVGFFLDMITYVEEHVDGDGLLDVSGLEGRCREFYEGFIGFRKTYYCAS